MIISAHQPAYMPWPGYLHKIAACKKFVILDNVQFEKNSFINRNYIMGANGSILLTVPIKLKNHLKLTINDIEIENNVNWKKKHLNSIFLSYKKSKHFEKHFHFFENLYSKDWDLIIDINIEILNYLMKAFHIETPIVRLSELSIKGEKNDLIINLCEKLNANTFIFGMNGKEYIDNDLFAKKKIHHFSQRYIYPKVSYRKKTPENNLSSIDLLFNLEKKFLNSFIVNNGIVE